MCPPGTPTTYPHHHTLTHTVGRNDWHVACCNLMSRHPAATSYQHFAIVSAGLLKENSYKSVQTHKNKVAAWTCRCLRRQSGERKQPDRSSSCFQLQTHQTWRPRHRCSIPPDFLRSRREQLLVRGKAVRYKRLGLHIPYQSGHSAAC